MLARETADPRGAVGEVAGRGRVVQTLQIVRGAEDWRHTGPTIATVSSSIVTIPVVSSNHVVTSVRNSVRSEDGGLSLGLGPALRDQKEKERN